MPEVTVQNINQQIEYPVAAPQPMGEAPAASDASAPMAELRAPTSRTRDGFGTAPGGFASQEEGNRYAPAPPPPPVASAPRTDAPARGRAGSRGTAARGRHERTAAQRG